jgi:hypothetical protein
MSRIGRSLAAAVAVAVAATALAACREEEQGRPLSFHKGTYEGAQGQTLTAEAVKATGDRVKRQQF